MASRLRDKAFISYSRDDTELLQLLLPHLSPEIRRQQIWWDGQIKAGQEWRNEIETALESAKVGVFLLSANFIASEFCLAFELPRLLDAAVTHGVKILWSLVRYCRWQETPLARYQSTPPYQKTHSMKAWNALNEPERDDLLRQVALDIADNLRSDPANPGAAREEQALSTIDSGATQPFAAEASPVDPLRQVPPSQAVRSDPSTARRLLSGVKTLKTIDEVGSFFVLARRWSDAEFTYGKLLDIAAPHEELWMARGYEKLARIHLQAGTDKPARECLRLAQIFYRWTRKPENEEEMGRLLRRLPAEPKAAAS